MSRTIPETPLMTSLTKNIRLIENLLPDDCDVLRRDFVLDGPIGRRGVLFLVDGMCDKDALSRYILEPLLEASPAEAELPIVEVGKKVLLFPAFKEATDLKTLCRSLLSGEGVLLLDGDGIALTLDTKKWDRRSVDKPATEKVVQGPREGFVETILVNRALIRRKLPHPDLVMKTLQIGRITQTMVTVVYLNGIAKQSLVQEVLDRLAQIDVDEILDSGEVEQLIEDNPFSLFSTMGNCEKPDKVAGKLLEGKVAILVDGTPIVLVVPQLFGDAFKSVEDDYSRPYFVSFIRLLRYVAFFISILSPGVFVAVACYHQRLIPYRLLLTMLSAESATPFPLPFALLFMMIVYELLREAGVRVPAPAGNALNIVGALVIGDAAVSAGLISAPVVIVVAVTAISSFVINPLVDAVSLLRLIFLFLATVLGAFGILIGLIGLLIHLISLRSFGVAYFTPFAPFQPYMWRDNLIKVPFWLLSRRPLPGPASAHRQGKNQKPKTPDKGGIV